MLLIKYIYQSLYHFISALEEEQEQKEIPEEVAEESPSTSASVSASGSASVTPIKPTKKENPVKKTQNK